MDKIVLKLFKANDKRVLKDTKVYLRVQKTVVCFIIPASTRGMVDRFSLN